MPRLLQHLLSPYMAPAGDDGGDAGGGATDRGDDWTPTGPDAEGDTPEEKKPEPKAEPEAAGTDDDDIDPEDPDAEIKAEEDKPKDKAQKKDSRVPLSRHKEILQKERDARAALEARLAQYEKGQEVAKTNEDITKAEDGIIALEKKYTELLAEGKLDEAAKTMREIRTAERQIVEAKSEMRVQAATAQATEQARYDVALERIETAYDVLNPDHDDFDKEVLTEVVEMKLFFQQMRNQTPTQALQNAVKKVLGAPQDRSQKEATTVTPRVSKEDVAAARKKAAVEKTAAATGKTPPDTSKVGMDSDKAGGGLSAKDVMKMSQEEFTKLPADILSRLRGDEFV